MPKPEGGGWKPRYNPWLIAVVVSLAAFMEILDTSIANVALPYMAGNLGVTNDESTWVLTSYLVANAVVLPISGWLAGVIGRKRYFMGCILLFTVSSILCGMAPSLPVLVVARVLQGACGGGLQPMAQAILADSFPPRKRGMAFAAYGLTAVVAPTVGPTLGGWITDNYSWRWIFFINLPVGALALFLVQRILEEPPWIKARGAGVKVDYLGIALLSLGVGALQIMLDKGQEKDWFGSRFILVLAVVAVVCLLSLAVWEWFAEHPVIDVRLFKNGNYLTTNLMMFMLGATFFSALVMMPQFLQTLLGYTAEKAGLVLSARGLMSLLAMPLIGWLTTKVQARRLVMFGWLAMAVATRYTAKHLDLLISFRTASWLGVAQAVGLPFLFIPLTHAAYAGLPEEKNNAASGMLNFMRNMGSSVGTSFVTTALARRAQFHQVQLAAHDSPYNPLFRRAAAALGRAMHAAPGASASVYASLYKAVQAQAQTLAYIDTFYLLTAAAAVMFALSFLLRSNDPAGKAPAGAP